MHIRKLQGKHICILGFGKEGTSTLLAIEKYAPTADITVADKNQELEIKNYEYQCGEHYLKNLDRFDVIIKSPGIPPRSLPPTTYHLVTSATQIFLDTIADTGATVIGVTGSKGKSTTASLIYEILRASPHPNPLPMGERTCHLIGNIGTPALDFLDKAKPGVIFVMELSSYQLMDLTRSPHIAVITSFFPDHLDYHGSLDAYWEAKSHITQFQTKDDVIFYSSKVPSPHPTLSRGERDEGTHTIAMLSPGKKIPFSEEDAPVTLEETRLIGHHNLRNIAGAWKVAEYLSIPREAAIEAIRAFRPLPHRLQSLGIHHGIEWIDDAISTTPESTIAALDALGNRVTTIILGGLDRGYDFTALAKCIAHSNIQTVILLVPSGVEVFPGSGPRIRKALEVAEINARLLDVESMQEAVLLAKNHSQFSILNSQFPIVLLSTASPSYNMFKNFEEKGDCFQKAIVSANMAL